jgi:cysteinyl-tRNA synthetase
VAGVVDVRLHDTRTGELVPLPDGPVGIYACGPTVYNRIHVGNARPFVVFSLLRRFLAHLGREVTFVANITDVNDKIYAAAREQGMPSAELAEGMAALYRADTDLLGLGRPDHEPLATAYVGEIVELIQDLIDRGAAYAAEGDVYFRVAADEAYGSLSHRRAEDMQQGEDDDGRKEDPRDFALWKAEKPGEDTAWDAPWGRGRPGWHIECSAMAEQLLGVGFAIHGGGSDLVFPHHENEAAQTRGARGEELARIWMHNGMLEFGGEKMAKSVGNVERLSDAVARWGPETLVMFFLGGHYRQPIQYRDDVLEDARARVARVREAARALPPGPSPEDMAPLRDRFLAALADDFNTPNALAALFEWIREANRRGDAGRDHLEEMLSVLGLDSLLAADRREPSPADLELLERRQAARAAKDWAEADRLRDELAAAGWDVRDSAGGPSLVLREG